ncbi:MAG: autoinducer binding domain-containing protein [Gammaproteobacteria bacterium]|jgi:DNA-binding CsgD family transcriptional regulator
MHRIFQAFIDRLADSVDPMALREAMADAAVAFDLHCFAYLSMPHRPAAEAQLISTYPSDWTGHYLDSRYERLDPVILQALREAEPFEWGMGVGPRELTKRQQQLFDEAAGFGIRCGFTIPIHDGRGPVAAVTFAADAHHPAFRRSVEAHAEVLQLMALYFHAHARRKLSSDRVVDGVALSPREFECLEWAAQGKSAWDIGRILGISRRTAAFHLDNAKRKLGVRSICQAVARLSASKPMLQ